MKFWIGLCCLCWSVTAAAAEVIDLVTEDAVPLHYRQDGQWRGEAPPFVEAVFQRAGVPFRHSVYPWARSYMLASTRPNVVIYSLARTPEREAQFHWIGRLVSIRYGLFALASHPPLRGSSLNDARQLRIGVTNNDVRAAWLRQQGFTDSQPGQHQGLDVADDGMANLRKLLSGRIDAVPTSLLGLQGYCITQQQDCRQFRQLMALPFQVDLYLAASLQTPDDTVSALQQAFLSLQRDGSHARAFRHYQ